MANVATGDVELDQKIRDWLTWDKNDKTRSEIVQLVDAGDVNELRGRMMKRMEFGTAGLRTRMGAGNSMMNDLTIIQSAQGLVKYLLANCPTVKQQGMAVGFDGRYNSDKFALLTATIAIQQAIPVYLFSKICPTPYVAFATRHYKCAAGVMVTASHNPKEDNGYKVYGSNGAQIISPVDKGISQCILENLEPWEGSWDVSLVENSPLKKDPYADVWELYNKEIASLCFHKEENAKSPVRFTYTAMHGVGYAFTEESCRVFGFSPLIPVLEQVTPDPEFPTVKYPNPEEGKGALTLSMKTADGSKSPVILANDPDADRLAVAEKLGDEWKIFTGNEIGALLGWWSWKKFKENNPEALSSDVYMLASTVSSKILGAIAQKEGFKFEETLTGFKWMGNIADQLISKGKTVLFAFEEAIGFMCGTVVLDKDGVSAAAVMAEMVTYLYKQNITLNQQVDNIYQLYGYHLTSNSYFICHDPPTITKMFDEIRNYNGSGKYPDSCGQFKIKYIRDLTTGYDNSQPDKKPVLPVSKSSHMITFTLENGCVFTLRTSGTEPKIKYYTEHRPDPSSGITRQEAEKELEDIVSCIVKYFYQPEKFGFIPRSD